jgi:hypothetical protein
MPWVGEGNKSFRPERPNLDRLSPTPVLPDRYVQNLGRNAPPVGWPRNGASWASYRSAAGDIDEVKEPTYDTNDLKNEEDRQA